MESNLTVKASAIHRARLAWSLYINYFIHGFGLIILAQNMNSPYRGRGVSALIVFAAERCAVGNCAAFVYDNRRLIVV